MKMFKIYFPVILLSALGLLFLNFSGQRFQIREKLNTRRESLGSARQPRKTSGSITEIIQPMPAKPTENQFEKQVADAMNLDLIKLANAGQLDAQDRERLARLLRTENVYRVAQAKHLLAQFDSQGPDL